MARMTLFTVRLPAPLTHRLRWIGTALHGIPPSCLNTIQSIIFRIKEECRHYSCKKISNKWDSDRNI